MRFSCKAAVEYDLKLHYELRDKFTEELKDRSEYVGSKMKLSKKKKGRRYYSVRKPDQTRFAYAGDSRNPDVIATRESAYYEKGLEVIMANIDILEELLAVYNKTSAEHINELLPALYTLPPDSAVLKMDVEIEKWLQENTAKKESYPTFDPDSLKVTAFDGTLVRSRAEAFHHEAFYIYGIPDIFELPYVIGKDVLRPDFTALDVYRMKPVMFEHLGNWFHEDHYKRERYRTEALHRIDEYHQIGFSPESNLLLTFGTNENTFDVQSIHRKIAMLAAPPPSQETIDLLKRL